jgi:myotubularin-related protein 6/7/8
MKSMWGRFSSNATAAFSAVQDATKDFRGINPSPSPGPAFSSYGGSGGSVGGSNYTDPSRRGSALGWSNDTWGSSTNKPLTTAAEASPWIRGNAPATSSTTLQGTRRQTAGGGDILGNNPWQTDSPTAIGPTNRTLEDEWRQSTAVDRSPANASLQPPLGGRPMYNTAPLAAPTPRYATSASSAPALTVPPVAGRQASPQATPSKEAPSDPLGVGL